MLFDFKRILDQRKFREETLWAAMLWEVSSDTNFYFYFLKKGLKRRENGITLVIKCKMINTL